MATAEETSVPKEAVQCPLPKEEVSTPLESTLELKKGTIYAIGGLGTSSVIEAGMERFHLSTGTWIKCTRLPAPNMAGVAVAVDKDIFLLGGTAAKSGPPSSAVWRYNIKEDTWFEEVPLPTPKHRHAAVAVGKNIFVIGGLTNKDELTASMDSFNVETKIWTKRASTLTARFAHAAVVVNNTIYAIGGATVVARRTLEIEGTVESKRLNTVEKYDIATNKWTPCTDMPSVSFDGNAVVIGQSIYVMGGQSEAKCTFNGQMTKYDITSDTWTNVGLMLLPRAAAGLVAFGPYIYVAGRD